MVRTGYNQSGEGIWEELGRLDKSLTELVNMKYDNILEIRIDWQGAAPTIYEIVTINNYSLPNITDLEELVLSSEIYKSDEYTVGSYTKFTEALKYAKDILNNLENANQEEIDKAKESLVTSITDLVNIEELRSIIESANNLINSDTEYTEVTLNVLKESVEAANVVLNNPDATKDAVSYKKC